MVEVIGQRQNHLTGPSWRALGNHLNNGAEGHVAARGHQHRCPIEVEPVLAQELGADCLHQGRIPLQGAIAMQLRPTSCQRLGHGPGDGLGRVPPHHALGKGEAARALAHQGGQLRDHRAEHPLEATAWPWSCQGAQRLYLAVDCFTQVVLA